MWGIGRTDRSHTRTENSSLGMNLLGWGQVGLGGRGSMSKYRKNIRVIVNSMNDTSFKKKLENELTLPELPLPNSK